MPGEPLYFINNQSGLLGKVTLRAAWGREEMNRETSLEAGEVVLGDSSLPLKHLGCLVAKEQSWTYSPLEPATTLLVLASALDNQMDFPLSSIIFCWQSNQRLWVHPDGGLQPRQENVFRRS